MPPTAGVGSPPEPLVISETQIALLSKKTHFTVMLP